MKNILDIEISCFKNYFSQKDPKPVNLLTWLTNDKYKPQVDLLRVNKDKKERNELKSKLPACTPSGTFDTEGNLVKHSGLICLDIDLADNGEIENFASLKKELAKIVNVAYCGLSVSGNGYFLLIPIAHPEKHQLHFDALKTDFLSIGIVIDKACRNVNRLRGYSYDSEPYFNGTAIPYTKTKEAFKPQRFTDTTDYSNDRIEQLIKKIVSSKQDITSDYSDWFKIGCSLATEFGESGRNYYHSISSSSTKYNQTECDKQFDSCLKGAGVNIETLFFIAKNHNIILN
jgi:hypothetical protein